MNFECPDCGSVKISTRIVPDKWLDVTYNRPVRCCGDCGCEWCDSEAEDAQMEAIKAAGYTVDDKGNVKGRA